MPHVKQKLPRRLWAVLGVATLLRLLLAALTEGYPYDMSCFVGWGDRLLAVGPARFYSADYFADYPPGYLWVLGLAAAVRAALGIDGAGAAGRVLLALAPAVCDAAIAALVWRAADACQPAARHALPIATFTALCPLMLFDTGVWKQIDGAFALPLLLCFWLLEEKRLLAGALCYGVALAIKPQALLAGPALAVCCLGQIADAWGEGATARRRALGRTAAGAALALTPPVLLALPFYGARVLPALVEKYWQTSGGYPYACVNAFNWLAALGGNWQPLQDAPALALPGGGTLAMPFSWQALGVAGLTALSAALLVLAARGRRAGRFSPVLLAAFYTVGVFTLAPCMHERYLAPGVLLTLLAAARWGDRRLYAAGFGLSLVGLLDLAAVYAQVGTEEEWFSGVTSQMVMRLGGVAQAACFALLAYAAWRVTARGPEPLPVPDPAPPCAAPAPQPAWGRREAAALLALTLATAALSFAYLGDTSAPQNGVDANGGAYTATVSLSEPQDPPAELWVYPGISIHNDGVVTVADADGAEVARYELGYTTPFTWARVAMAAGPGPYTVTVEDGQLLELCLCDAGGGKLPLQPAADGPGPLFDEQALAPRRISQLNSFYFDEIYHARTAYEQLHRLPVYETTHPPLGKDLIMLGIALFGMTGFGWRFAGTLFGVLLVPLAWCFARRLTRRPRAGALAGAVLALDLMRFAQSRIATVDIFVTFFILLGAYCMLWYCQSVLQRGVDGSLAPMALGGLAFGLGCAAKWTGIYAGAGLAVLYLGVLWARWRQRPPHFAREFRLAAAGGVAFYILLPLCVYIASYLPFVWRDPNFGLRQLWQAQVSMYNYHTSLQATHSFESRWYTWLLGLRPVWYYSSAALPGGLRGTIAGLGGPVVWLGGLACLLWLLWRQAGGRGTPQGACVLILYAAQLLPWVLVRRCTFLYHYFPSSMFCLAALALAASRLPARRARRAGALLCAVSAVVFVCYYPAVSGLPVPGWWIEALRVLPSFGF